MIYACFQLELTRDWVCSTFRPWESWMDNIKVGDEFDVDFPSYFMNGERRNAEAVIYKWEDSIFNGSSIDDTRRTFRMVLKEK